LSWVLLLAAPLVASHAHAAAGGATAVEPGSNVICGPLVRTKIYHLSRLESGVRFYYLAAEFANTDTSKSWGVRASFPLVEGDPTVTFARSEPTLLRKGETMKTFLLARSTQRFGSVAVNTLQDVSGIPYFADNFVIEHCAPLTGADLLIRAVPGREYTFQKSGNLRDWSDFASVINPLSDIVWMSVEKMRSQPAPAMEFYRIDAECSDATDCQNEGLRLNESVRELRRLY
jgi:hypothetical protein